MKVGAQILNIKREFFEHLQALAETPLLDVERKLAQICTDNIHWRSSHPMNECSGVSSAFHTVWQPLKDSFPDLERRDLIFVGGVFEGRYYVACMGHYCGTFEKPWLGIPPNGKATYIRYGEVFEIVDGKIVQANCIWDVLDVARQAGFWPLVPSKGVEGMWSGPLRDNGIVLHETDEVQSATSLTQTLAMHKTLGDYNDTEMKGRQGLLDMQQRLHWHPKMMWYGPSGIGTTRGLAGFVDHHQLPFRIAFPNRKGGNQWDEIISEKKRLGGGHYIHIGDGPFSVTGGWPSVFAQHLGDGFLGQPTTGKNITMRVMDFYFHDEGLIRENWVPIDMLDILIQMGVDVLSQLKSKS